MNEKQPLMGPSATSQPSTCQTTSAWPLDRHQIWQGLTGKSIWIEAVVGVITQIIWTACFSSTSLSLVALYNMAFPFVPMYIATKVILKPLLDRGFGRLFGPCFSRRSARQPTLPLLDLRPEDIPEFQSRTALPTLPPLRAVLERPGFDLSALPCLTPTLSTTWPHFLKFDMSSNEEFQQQRSILMETS